MATTDRKSFWAWCMESEEPTDAERTEFARHLSERFGTSVTAKPVPKVEDAELRASRIQPPDSVSEWCSTSTYDRARCTYGAHFTERVRAFNLDFPNPPDVVAHPRTEDEIVATLDWCDQNGYVTVPYGGGSSVVWGLAPPEARGPPVIVSLGSNPQLVISVPDEVWALNPRNGKLKWYATKGVDAPSVSTSISPYLPTSNCSALILILPPVKAEAII